MNAQNFDYKEIIRQNIYKNSNIPLRWLNKNIPLQPEIVDESAFRRLKHIMDESPRFVRENWNLNLYSRNTGNGKTSWAIKIMKNFIDNYACVYDLDCLYVNIPEFMNLRKRSINDYTAQLQCQQLENRIMEARLVIMDAVASKQASSFDMELLYQLVNYRSTNQKSTIYTSNIKPDELRNLVGERLADRITGTPKTVNIELHGRSMRGFNITR